MAHKKLEKVEFASVKDIDVIEKELDMIRKNSSKEIEKMMAEAKKLAKTIKTIHFYNRMADETSKKLFELDGDLRIAFKKLGIDIPDELKNRFRSLERLKQDIGNKNRDSINNAKNTLA